jgi:hypothetical protein
MTTAAISAAGDVLTYATSLVVVMWCVADFIGRAGR